MADFLHILMRAKYWMNFEFSFHVFSSFCLVKIVCNFQFWLLPLEVGSNYWFRMPRDVSFLHNKWKKVFWESWNQINNCYYPVQYQKLRIYLGTYMYYMMIDTVYTCLHNIFVSIYCQTHKIESIQESNFFSVMKIFYSLLAFYDANRSLLLVNSQKTHLLLYSFLCQTHGHFGRNTYNLI